jgi:hypothetical protein
MGNNCLEYPNGQWVSVLDKIMAFTVIQVLTEAA